MERRRLGRARAITAYRVARELLSQAIEEIHLIHAFVLGLDGTTRFQFEQCFNVPGNSFRDVDPTGQAVRFHEGRGVHSVAPNIEANRAPLFFKNGFSNRPVCSGVPASKIGRRPSTVPNIVKVMLAFTL
jgi:hypothetical protein